MCHVYVYVCVCVFFFFFLLLSQLFLSQITKKMSYQYELEKNETNANIIVHLYSFATFLRLLYFIYDVFFFSHNTWKGKACGRDGCDVLWHSFSFIQIN